MLQDGPTYFKKGRLFLKKTHTLGFFCLLLISYSLKFLCVNISMLTYLPKYNVYIYHLLELALLTKV